MMTLETLRSDTREFITPADIAPILGCKPYSINMQAKADASKLGFPVCMMGTNVRIPRRAFLRWTELGNTPAIIKERETND